MSSYNPHLSGNNQPNKNIDQIFLLFFITLNGISTGSLVRTSKHIIAGDADYIISAMLWLGCTIYTAQRAIEIYKKIHKNDNDKSR